MIHQKKGNIVLCLAIDVILRLDIHVKKNDNNAFFHFYFLNVHILVNNKYETLKLCIHVANILGEGTVSQNFFFLS